MSASDAGSRLLLSYGTAIASYCRPITSHLLRSGQFMLNGRLKTRKECTLCGAECESVENML